eukprot:5486039-Pyramimonas_sp.AAC.1
MCTFGVQCLRYALRDRCKIRGGTRVSRLKRRSMFGKQHDSRKGNSPAFGFGSSNRDGAEKVRNSFAYESPMHQPASCFARTATTRSMNLIMFVFLTAEHAKSLYGIESPGPVYDLKSSVGTYPTISESCNHLTCWSSQLLTDVQHFSQCRAMPYGNRVHARLWYPNSPPITARYVSLVQTWIDGDRASCCDSTGKQESSKNENAPQFSFGTADRFNKQAAASSPARSAVPGPGAYGLPSSIGKQGESTKLNDPVFGFGTSTRTGAQRIFLSRDHAKSDFGKCSPGPSVYTGKSAVGRQPDSKKENSPSWVFSSEERFKYDHVERAAHVPGAGQYNTIGSVGPQAESKKGNIPRFSF